MRDKRWGAEKIPTINSGASPWRSFHSRWMTKAYCYRGLRLEKFHTASWVKIKLSTCSIMFMSILAQSWQTLFCHAPYSKFLTGRFDEEVIQETEDHYIYIFLHPDCFYLSFYQVRMAKHKKNFMYERNHMLRLWNQRRGRLSRNQYGRMYWARI